MFCDWKIGKNFFTLFVFVFWVFLNKFYVVTYSWWSFLAWNFFCKLLRHIFFLQLLWNKCRSTRVERSIDEEMFLNAGVCFSGMTLKSLALSLLMKSSYFAAALDPSSDANSIGELLQVRNLFNWDWLSLHLYLNCSQIFNLPQIDVCTGKWLLLQVFLHVKVKQRDAKLGETIARSMMKFLQPGLCTKVGWSSFRIVKSWLSITSYIILPILSSKLLFHAVWWQLMPRLSRRQCDERDYSKRTSYQIIAWASVDLGVCKHCRWLIFGYLKTGRYLRSLLKDARCVLSQF